jgi:hypothetical protein
LALGGTVEAKMTARTSSKPRIALLTIPSERPSLIRVKRFYERDVKCEKREMGIERSCEIRLTLSDSED